MLNLVLGTHCAHALTAPLVNLLLLGTNIFYYQMCSLAEVIAQFTLTVANRRNLHR